MSVLPLVHWPDARLSQPCAPVEDPASVSGLARDMLDTMYAAKGRGLAAPQVGVLSRVFVMDAGWKDGAPEPMVCIDPHVLSIDDTQVVGEEVCLSVPGVAARVARPTGVRFGYFDETGAERRVALSGAAARIALHEMDHLDGRMHFDRLDAAARDALLARYDGS